MIKHNERTNDMAEYPEIVEVLIRLPKPPDGWEWDGWRSPCNGEMYLSVNGEKFLTANNECRTSQRLCCRRIWTPPANAIGTFYPCGLVEWFFTNRGVSVDAYGCRNLSPYAIPATVFSDFTPPPERRPYKVDRGVEVKDGAK